LKKIAQFLENVAKKYENSNIKAEYVSLKPQHQTTLETLKYQ